MDRRREDSERDPEQLLLWVNSEDEPEAVMAGHRPEAVRQPSARGSVIARDALWSMKDVSSFLGVPVATIYQWRVKGDGPPATRMGKHLRYEPAVVRSWVSEHREGA